MVSEFNYLTHQRKMVEFHQDTNIKHYELNFIGDVKSGVYKRFGDGGIELVIGQYDNNKKIGEWISKFDEGGVREKENYKDGYLHGEYEKRHPNGEKWEVFNYKNGSLDGLCYTYHSNGELISAINYEESKIIGEVNTFHPNGEKKSVGTDKNLSEEEVALVTFLRNTSKSIILKTRFSVDLIKFLKLLTKVVSSFSV